MVAMASPWKHPKTGVYWFRRAVPADLRDTLGWEVKRSLGTRSVAEAKRLMAAELERFDQKVAAARSGFILTSKQAQALAGKWLEDQLAKDGEEREVSDRDEFIKKASHEGLTVHDLELDALAEAFERGDFARWVEKDLATVIAAEALPLTPAHPSYRVLAEQLLLAKIKLLNAKNRRARGDWRLDTSLAEYPAYSSPLRKPEPSKKPVQASGKGDLLSNLFTAWRAERNPVAKTDAEFSRAIRRFIELHGDVPAINISKPMVRAYKDALRRLPTHLSGPMRKMTVPQLLAVAQQQPTEKTLSIGAVNKDLGSLSAVLAWAGKNGYFDDNPNWTNPALGLKIEAPKVEAERRLPYDLEDFKAIFGSPVFTEGKRPSGGAAEAAKWLPLMALFTGARLEELGQLLCRDVAQEGGIWRVHINTLDEGKRVKTASSRRKVPVHDALVRCGFLSYVEARQQEGSDRLFPVLEADQHGKLTGNWSKWWGRYVRGIGITDRRKVFHSFRHTFKDAVRAAGVDEAINDALTGHSGGGVGRTYGVGYNLATLNGALQKVAYTGLDLSHVEVGDRPQRAA